MPEPVPVTIDDVAANCRVAKSTVSKVLGRQPDRYHIAEATRKRILAAAHRLGFAPQLRRQVAASKPLHNIALLFEKYAPFTDGIFQGLPTALAQAADERGFRISFHPITDGIDGWRRGMHHHACVGAILTAPLPHGIELLPKLGLPVVVFNEDTVLPFVHVQCDDRASARIATQHLIDLGHRRIAFLRSKGGTGAHYSCTERRLGYEDAMRTACLAPLEFQDTVAEDLIRETIPRNSATAIVTYSHLEALGVLFSAWRLGLRVPDQLSVVSLDSMYLLGRSCPPLTAMDIPLVAMANITIEAVLAMIGSGVTVRECRKVPCTLTVRHSTAPPHGE